MPDIKAGIPTNPDAPKNIWQGLERVNQDKQYTVADIPAHTQNGVDSNQVDPNNLVNSSLYFAVNRVVLSSDKIKALNTTPITLVPAVGVGTSTVGLNSVIIVEGITAKIYFNTTAYTGANALEFRYANASGAKVTADIPNTFINSTSNTYAHAAGIVTAFTPVPFAPIVVRVPTADPATGDGYMVISTKYRVVTI